VDFLLEGGRGWREIFLFANSSFRTIESSVIILTKHTKQQQQQQQQQQRQQQQLPHGEHRFEKGLKLLYYTAAKHSRRNRHHLWNLSTPRKSPYDFLQPLQ